MFFSPRASRFAVTALLTIVSACGQTLRDLPEAPSARVAARLPQRVFDTAPGGVRIASLPRATPGVVRLALYVDAGSRDAALPQTATLAAWLAAESAGSQLEATAFPDSTEIALACTTDGLQRCLTQLAAALAFRDPSPAALSAARQRLRDGLRRALARDKHEGVDRLALHALLGAAAQGFFPLGTADADLTAAGDAVQTFLRDHYGPTRVIVVAAGEVEPSALRDLVSQTFSHAPRALLTRTTRKLEPNAQPQLSVKFDDRAALTFALEGESETVLRTVAVQLEAALAGSDSRTHVTGSVFAARSGALSLLRVETPDALAALSRAAQELVRIQTEARPTVSDALHADDLAASSREVGLAFGADGVVVQHTFRFAAGIALAAGDDAGPAAGAQQKDREQARVKHALASWQAALAQGQPATHGDSDEAIAAVALDNGAQIDVQFSRGDDVAVAIRIGVGADQDSPLLHGQAALLSTLTGLSCAGMGSEVLQQRLGALGAVLEARVDAESYGALLRVPKSQLDAALDLALRCLRTPSSDAGDLVAASVRLQQQLRKPERHLLLRARAANLVAPRAPGALAPWGDPDRIANFSPRDLAQLLPAIQFGKRWSVAVVGPVNTRDTVAFVARRLADLSGALPKPAPWSDPMAVLPAELPHSRDASGVNVLAVWTAHGAFDDVLGARLYASALAALLGAVPGIEVLAHDADSYQETSFAALGLHLRPDLTSALPALLAGAARSIDNAWLDRALQPAVEHARASDNADQAQFAARAERIARQRLGGRFPQPNAKNAARLLQALRDSKPGFAGF